MELQVLLKEKEALLKKLKAVEGMIAAYSDAGKAGSNTKTKSFENYPLLETRKDKIIFVLEASRSKMTVEEIWSEMHKYEPSLKFPLNQYCSGMASRGEIGVEKGGHKHRYFFIAR